MPAEQATTRTLRVLAPNPGPMTLEGTNTWVLAEAESARAVVLDPGPDDAAHRAAITSTVVQSGRRVALIVLTHGHPDHSAGARALAAETGAPVRAFDPAHRLGDEGLADGDVIEIDGLVLRALATPGHSADHVCLVLPADDAVLTGDHVLGRGTTVVAHPDGRLRDYLDSLERLRDVGARVLLPGHGPVVDDPARVIGHYLTHRAERLQQVEDALAALGLAAPRELVERIYADVDPVLWAAAELSVRAALELLLERGRVAVDAAERFELVR